MKISTLCLACSRECVFEHFAIFEVYGHMDHLRQIFGVEIKLLEQRGNKFLRIEILKIFPVKFTAIHDAAAAQVKKIGGHLGCFGVKRQHIGVVTLR